MPIYEYLCETCGNTVEIITNKMEDRVGTCKRCLCYMTKIISRSTFVLKDGKSGWGKDGYKDK